MILANDFEEIKMIHTDLDYLKIPFYRSFIELNDTYSNLNSFLLYVLKKRIDLFF